MPPTEKRKNSLPRARAIERPTLVLPTPGRPDEADDRALGVLFELPDREVFDDPVLDVLEAVVIRLEDRLGLRQVEVPRHRGLPGERADEVQPIARHDELARVGVHQIELFQLLLDLLLHFAFEFEGVDLLLETLVVRALGVRRHAQLALDGLELLAEEVLALALFDLLVDLRLDALLDLEQLLLLLDEDEDLLHPLAHVGHLEDLLLIVLVDIEDGSDEVRDLARMVDIDHVEAHLLGKEGIILRNLLHLTEKGPR